MSSPLLRAAGARIAVDGATVVAELDLETAGDRVVLAGDASPLMEALLGAAVGPDSRAGATSRLAATVVAGRLELAGRDVGRGEHRAAAGLAPRDPPLPARWTVAEYLGWSGRLAGLSGSAARAAADQALERLAFGATRRRQLGSLSRVERRAAVLAQALVGDPEVLVCDGPLSDLRPDEATWVAHVLARAGAERRTVISVLKLVPPSPEAELVRSATDVCVLRGGALLVHADPSTLFAGAMVAEVSVRRDGSALQEELAGLGAVVRGGPLHFAVALPEGLGLSDVLAAAARVDVPVVRCLPLMG